MRADILLALNDDTAIKYGPQIEKNGILIAEKKIRDRMIPIAFSDIARTELGNKIYANTMAIGALAAEIAAVNIAIGASFAEARAMTGMTAWVGLILETMFTKPLR